uniref:Peptidyl-prolyl cis-trans isomerase n=1 Tax=Populus trichocarpa TaxID=3694 RepID=A0A2K1ZEA5_POPTR
MGKDSKAKDAGAKGKGKGKQAGGGSDENASKGKGKSGKASDGLGTCTYVKARHILCEKQGKINEAYQKLQDGWLSNGDKVPPAEFAKLASEYSECPSGKKGGDLGWKERRRPWMVPSRKDGGSLSRCGICHSNWSYKCTIQVNTWVSRNIV